VFRQIPTSVVVSAAGDEVSCFMEASFPLGVELATTQNHNLAKDASFSKITHAALRIVLLA
jgi:hypothetical protein